MITTEHIAMKRGIRYVVDNVSLEIHKQQRWILFGLNGCGKTTLLSALAGYQGLSKGLIKIENNRLLNQETKQAWRTKTGFVSSSFFNHCYHTESVLDIVLSGLYGKLGITGQVNSACIKKAKNILAVLGLEKKFQYPYDSLSSGQQQKVLLARAMINEPVMLFLDEPFSALDILGRMQVQELLDTWLLESCGTLICVTHHCDEITPAYTHTALMKNGTIHSCGAIRDVFTTENMCHFLGKDVIVTWQNEQLKIDISKEKRGNYYGKNNR